MSVLLLSSRKSRGRRNCSPAREDTSGEEIILEFGAKTPGRRAIARIYGESAGFSPIMPIGVFPSSVKTATLPEEKKPTLKRKEKRRTIGEEGWLVAVKMAMRLKV